MVSQKLHYQLDVEQMSKLRHDLHAPVTTSIAFKGEIDEAIEELSELIDSLGSELSAESRLKIHNIIENDMMVCANHLELSIKTLQSFMTKFTNECLRFPEDNVE